MADGSVIIDTKIDQTGIKTGLADMAKTVSGGVVKALEAAAAALVAIGGYAVSVGKKFETSMSQVMATMGITKTTIENGKNSYEILKKAAADAGATTVFSASEAADALNYLALAGYDAQKAAQALPAVLKLAQAGGLDLAYASDLATDAMAALSIEATNENLTLFGDKMAKTASKANTSVAQLGEAILTVGGTAKSLAGGTTELNAALGVLANRGIKGSEGGTALRNVILSLSAPNKNAAEQIEKLGLKIYDSTGKMRPLNDVFKDLNKSMKNMTEGEKTQVLAKLFHRVDLKSAQALLAGCGEEFQNLSDAIDKANGSMEQMASTMTDNLEGDLKSLKSRAEAFGISLYEDISNPLRDVVKTASGYLVELKDAFDKTGFDGLASSIGNILSDAVTKIVSVAPKLNEMAVTLISSLVEGVVDNLPAISEGIAKSGIEIVNGLTKILPLIAKGAGDLTLSLCKEIANNAPTIIDSFVTMLSDVLDNASSILPKIAELAVIIINKISVAITKNAPVVISSIMKLISAIITAISNNLSSILSAVLNAIIAVSKEIVKNLPTIVNSIVELANGIVKALVDNLPILVDGIKTLIVELVKALPDVVDILIEGVISLVNEIIDSLPTIIPILVEALIAIVQALAEELPKCIDKLVDGVIKLVEGITDALPQIIDAIIAVLPQLIESIVNALVQLAPKLIDAGIKLFTSLVEALPDIIAKICDKLPEIISSIVHTLTENIPKIVECGVSLLTSLITNMPQIILAIVEKLPDIISSIVGGLVESFPEIVKCGFDLFMSLVKDLPKAIIDIVSKVPEIITKIVSGLGDVFWKIVECGKDIVSKLWEGIKSCFYLIVYYGGRIIDKIWEGIKTACSVIADIGGEIVHWLWEAIKGIGSTLWDIGKSIVEGIWNGIKSAFTSITKPCTAELDKLVEEMKKKEEIHSPSKRTARLIGKPLSEGIAEGIKSSSGKIADEMEKIADEIDDTAIEYDVTSNIDDVSFDDIYAKAYYAVEAENAGVSDAFYTRTAQTYNDSSTANDNGGTETNPQYVVHATFVINDKEAAQALAPALLEELEWEGK